MNSYSQSGQDLFVWEQSGHKKGGTFIDIGCNDPVVHNNTLALEQQGWTGVSVDIEKFDYSGRINPFVQADARRIIPAVEHFVKRRNGVIDYLSLDADDATFDAMTRLIPFYKFGCVTLEHDKYRLGPELQSRMRDYMKTFGYDLFKGDVIAPECHGQPWSLQPFEDWFVLRGSGPSSMPAR